MEIILKNSIFITISILIVIFAFLAYESHGRPDAVLELLLTYPNDILGELSENTPKIENNNIILVFKIENIDYIAVKENNEEKELKFVGNEDKFEYNWELKVGNNDIEILGYSGKMTTQYKNNYIAAETYSVTRIDSETPKPTVDHVPPPPKSDYEPPLDDNKSNNLPVEDDKSNKPIVDTPAEPDSQAGSDKTKDETIKSDDISNTPVIPSDSTKKDIVEVPPQEQYVDGEPEVDSSIPAENQAFESDDVDDIPINDQLANE